MKKVISILMCVLLIASAFSVLSVSASAATPTDVMYVKSSVATNGKITYDVYLKKNVSIIGAIVKVVYDPEVLKPVSAGAHGAASSLNGIFVEGPVADADNAYSIAFVAMDTIKIGNADKAFMTISFEVVDKSYPKTDVSFYCVEFNTPDTSKKIEKNDANPPLIAKLNTVTLRPTMYKGVSQAENGNKIEWNATPGATGYTVYKHNGSAWVVVKKTTELSYTDTAAAINKTEKYAVRAYNASGADSSFTAITAKFGLGTPVVTLKGIYGGVQIKWNKIEGAGRYGVYRQYKGTGKWVRIATVSSDKLTYTDTAAISCRNIYYTVRAEVSLDGATWKNGSFKGVLISYVGVPRVTSVANGSSGVVVKWGKVANATGYKVYRRTSTSGWQYLGSTTGTAWADKTPKSGVTYRYTVRATKGSYISNFESGKAITYVAAPKISKLQSVSNGISVSWASVGGAKSYKVYRQGPGYSGWKYMGTVTAAKFTDTKTVKGQTYKYTVRAVASNGTISTFLSGSSITRK